MNWSLMQLGESRAFNLLQVLKNFMLLYGMSIFLHELNTFMATVLFMSSLHSPSNCFVSSETGWFTPLSAPPSHGSTSQLLYFIQDNLFSNPRVPSRETVSFTSLTVSSLINYFHLQQSIISFFNCLCLQSPVSASATSCLHSRLAVFVWPSWNTCSNSSAT